MSEANRVMAIYVPGLGDDRTLGQDKAVKGWQSVGIKLEYYPVGWADGELFEAKLARLLKHIDELYEKAGPVALLGASAGAGCVLNAAAQRPDKVFAVVSICGKINNPRFADPVFNTNPAFAGSLKMLPGSLRILQEKHTPILSVNSVYDQRVPLKDTVIDGAQTIRMPMILHVPTIAYAITLGKHRIARWIRSNKTTV